MISAFSVDHGEISKGWLKGSAESVNQAYVAGRLGRTLKRMGSQTSKLGIETDRRPEEFRQSTKAAKEFGGLASRAGYYSPEIAGGSIAAAAGGGGYAYGKKRKKGSR